MKTNFTNNEIVHVWASQTQRHGQANSMSFHGDTIFSYREPIGRFLPDGSVALNRRSYSVTTSAHQSAVSYAVHHLNRIYIDDVVSPPASQLKPVRDKVFGLLNQASFARMTKTKEKHRAEAVRVAEQFNLYAEAHKSRIKINVEKIAGQDLDKLRELIERQNKAEAAKKRRADAKQAKEDAIAYTNAVVNWRANGTHHYSLRRQPVMLRLRHDREVVWTSHDAQIPVDDAKRLWPVILRVMAGDRDYEVGQDLGRYRLTMIRRDGSIRVGCHDIAHSEIEGIAVQLGLKVNEEMAA